MTKATAAASSLANRLKHAKARILAGEVKVFYHLLSELLESAGRLAALVKSLE